MLRHCWQKSSFSAQGDACLYLTALASGVIGLQESDAPEAILTTTPAKLRTLISHIQTDAFNR
ncbi:DUF397 domain-containing protein [Streptomyces sp. UNOC14_S4]|uniref:DUF397 domain-containing protein n=1 Tax=Streptomyces sp. UNOC14_S4 TaxID=2872340 RepID=UPI001E516189|nr:DUF397 domain-containing protein [Streptomyces sp. UNOC14_S4]MCC3766692.1 DUF397 domain-containing protein [Streptomyces sp. UNOC14_S4]